MENNNGFNQDLLNLIEGSRFKGSRPLKRKEPTADTTSEQNKPPAESPSILPSNNNNSQEAPIIPVQPAIPSMITNRKNFEMTYGMIKEMRRDKTAPVDTMGSYQNPDLSATKEVQDYQLLVSLLLSVQTMDEPCTRAMNKLIEHGLTLENIEVTDEEELKKMISCVNFKNNKAKYIKKCTNIILNKYKGIIPNKREELLKLPGVGKEIAIVYLNHAHDKKSGIGVDSHIQRISNRLGWVDTKTPENTRTELESFIPKEYWYDMNELLIGFGQQICTPIAPKCDGCLLRTICPTGIRNTEAVPKVVKNLKKVKKNNEEQKTDEELALIKDEGSTSNSNLVGDILGSQDAGLNEINDEMNIEKSLNQEEPKEDELS